MTNYPYILKTSTIKGLLEKIPDAGVPDLVGHKFIYSLGFKSNNDRPILKILQHIKFIDDNGVPTERYRQYRNRSASAKILGHAIKDAYADLYNVYPDAHARDNESLRNFFTTHSTLGARAVGGIVETFKTLSALADFTGMESAIKQAQTQELSEELVSQPLTSVSHRINLALGEGRIVQVIMPADITKHELDRLKKLIGAYEPS